MRRRWTLKFQTATGEDAWLNVEVPRGGGGQVHANVGEQTAVFDPREVAKLRQIYLEALAAAFWERGGW